jgi:hypothetical protein
VPRRPRSPIQPRRPRVDVRVESDLPIFTRLLPWERELLVPLAEQLVEAALAEDTGVEQTANSHPDAKDKDQNPRD